MTARNYMVVTATIFTVVAILHALRLAFQIPVRFGSAQIPMWLSGFGVLVPALIALWGFSSSKQD